MERNGHAIEEKCMDIAYQPQKHLTDSGTWALIRRSSGCENAAAFQRLERDRRDAALREALKGGASLRQTSRLTGVSFGVIRGLVKG